MIEIKEYIARRDSLMSMLEANSIAILASSNKKIRNRDNEYPFRQGSDFFYLTGFNEDNAVMVLIPGREQGEYVLFCKEKNELEETWTGVITGQEQAVSKHGADDAFPINDINEILPGLIEGKTRVYFDMESDHEFYVKLIGWIESIKKKTDLGSQPPREFALLAPLIHEMRLYKSEAEIDIMRQAAYITASAHKKAMQAVRPNLHEYNLYAHLSYEFQKQGALENAYTPIIASGRNACILHYTDNNAKIADGDLVLIDAGCELYCYASDLTRTFPASGKFTHEQKAIYQIVLDANIAAINMVKPGNRYEEIHSVAVEVITQGLINLGILQGNINALIEDQAYKRFYMHKTGHWLGLDVHDVGDYKIGNKSIELAANMVLTIEPGIYISDKHKDIDDKWHNIGIRIEDTVVVKQCSAEVLTKCAPKTVEEIEELMMKTKLYKLK